MTNLNFQRFHDLKLMLLLTEAKDIDNTTNLVLYVKLKLLLTEAKTAPVS